MALPLKSLGATLPNTSPVVLSAASENLPPALVRDPSLASELLNNTMILYGPTGSRKTTQIGEYAKYIYERTGKTTRLVTCDGGGYSPIQDLVNAGIIIPWRINEEKNPKVALVKASRGAWPDAIHNGLRASKLITEPGYLDRGAYMEKNNVGAYAIESWASIGQLIISDLVSRGQKISEDIVGSFTETTEYGSESFGAPAKSHFGFVQNFILGLIRNFSSIPVERVLYTSIEGKGEDRLTKQLQYGPQVAGNAITASVPTYVGDCLHFEDFTEDIGPDPLNPSQKLVESKVRVWFTQHPDLTTKVMWPAKPRVVGAKYSEFRDRMGKNGYFVLGKDSNLGTYLRLQDDILTSSSDAARAWKADIDSKRKEREKNG